MPTDRISSLDTNRIAKIMTAALEEFAKHPYEQASYNRIIKASGLSKGTMYYYFKSKEDLFQTLLQASRREFSELTPKVKTLDNPNDFWQCLCESMEMLYDLLRAKPITGRFMVNLLREHSGQIKTPSKQIIDAVDSLLEGLILKGQLIGAIRRDIDVDLSLSLIWSIWHTTTKWWQTSTEPQESRKIAHLTTQLLQRSLECPENPMHILERNYRTEDKRELIQP